MKLTNLSKEELIEEIKKLKSRKKYGLVWEDKPEDVVEDCKKKLPVLIEDKDKAIISNKALPTNLIIEGDNFHALSVLNYTHQGKIDVIYIDPPYNTGNKSWKYNNDYVDKDDTFRHSKWLSFMAKRLELAYNLLTEDGVVIVTVDDYEVFNLGLLLNRIFGEENKLGVVTIVHNPRGRSDDKYFATSHEYALFYGKNSTLSVINKLTLNEEQRRLFNLMDEISNYRLLPLRRSGSNSTKEARPNLHYPLYFNKITKELSVENSNSADVVEILPIDNSGINRVWRWGKETVRNNIKDNIVVKENNGKYSVFAKDRIKDGRRPMTHWVEPKYDASSHGTMLLKKMFGEKVFDYPKSIYALLDTLLITTAHKKEAIILDYFAGSGTTGHAVLMQNKEDVGNRKFILCTNNENNIAEEVTYPRIKKVIEGYSNNQGIPSNVRYFKTAFVSKSKVSDDTRNSLVRKSVEMICVRENTFDKVTDNKGYKIYLNNEIATGILFDLDEIEAFKKELKSLNMPSHIYVFSLTNDTYTSDFEDLAVKHDLCPIPESILEVYRKLFRQ